MEEKILYWQSQKIYDCDSVYQAAQKRTEKPSLLWFEPRYLPNFHPLWGDRSPCLSRELPEREIVLEEARLFYSDGMAHIVETARGIWCFECSENMQMEEKEKVVISKSEIFLRRDWDRFGLDFSPEENCVEVVEYKRNGLLFAWRITGFKETG